MASTETTSVVVSRSANDQLEDKRRRRKKWAPKVATGCITCRSRHVKCDEARPYCKRCVTTHRKCEGYTSMPASLRICSISPVVAPAGIQTSAQQKHFFHLLQNETIRQVAGTFDQSFWTVDVMRATQTYPAIWHAGLAMAAMYQRMRITAQTDLARRFKNDCYIFALKEHEAAIQSLLSIARQQGDLADADKETLLLANILFMGLCCLQEDISQAMNHARSGIQLFYDWKFWERADQSPASTPGSSILNVQSLVTLMHHFDSQFMLRSGAQPITSWCGESLPRKCSPDPYTSISEAYYEFQPLLNGFMETGRHLGIPCDRLQIRIDNTPAYHHEFSIWRAKFDAYLQSDMCKPEDIEGILLLKLLWADVDMNFLVSLDAPQTAFDDYLPRFQEMIELSEQIFIEQTKFVTTQNLPCFQFALSICEVLYFVGTSCRDGLLRRRAIELLEKWPRKDGIWDAKLIAMVCRTAMELEEEAVLHSQTGSAGFDKCECVFGEYICNDHRVCYSDIEFAREGEARVTLMTVRESRLKLPQKVFNVRW